MNKNQIIAAGVIASGFLIGYIVGRVHAASVIDQAIDQTVKNLRQSFSL